MSHGIVVDGTTYDVCLTDVSLTTDFLMKYAKRNESGELLYELIGVFFNQTMTISQGKSGTDFAKLWDLLSDRSSVDGAIGHNVQIWTPIGKLVFMMYTGSITLNMYRIDDSDDDEETYWSGMKLSFIATKPSRS